MKKKSAAVLTSALIVSIALTGCGTTLGENTGIFFKEMSDVFSDYRASRAQESGSTSASTESAGEQLASVSGFTVAEDGSYSFTGNTDAAYYVITVCAPEATGDDDTYLYSSERIDEDGSGTYTGNVFDMFTIPYGDYLVKCFAYPEIGDDTYSRSGAQTASLRVSGDLVQPQIEYLWNIFSGTLTFQLENTTEYNNTILPDSVDVMVTGDDGSEETYTIDIDPSQAGSGTTFGMDAAVSSFTVTVSDLPEGTYSFSSVAHSASEYVTAADTAEVDVADDVELGKDNVISDGYTYVNTGLAHGFSWPVVTKTLDPTKESSLGKYNGVDFISEPAESTEGTTADSVYSFTFSAAVGFGETGWFELYSDGTFTGHNGTAGPVSASTMKGTWYLNDDGETITLNYDMDSIEVGT